ncbi:MAG: hypothetical protein JWO04_1473 [Gammaproteobacteria bacterium]|nr:hypothetical protein [Gammaproteobacteria bacterium]
MKVRPAPKEPCHCGSGKMYKKCHGRGRIESKTRPREVTLWVNPGDKPVESLTFDDNHVTGETILLSNGVPIAPEQAFIEYGYTRRNGKKKATLRVPFVDDKLTHHPERYREERFAGYIAIDTNTEAIGQETVSVTAAMIAKVERGRNGNLGDLVLMQDLVFEFRDPTENAERIGWWEVLRTMELKYHGLNVGVITDCDMNAHPLINARLQPIRADFFLPPRIFMLYASTDTPGDSAENKLLQWADRRASAVMDWTKANPSDDGWEPLPPNAPYGRIRRWSKDALDRVFRGGLKIWSPAPLPGVVPSDRSYPNVTVRLKP